MIPDDVITVFSKENCQFGFASHLFGNELRSLANNQARGASFRISPTATSNNSNCETWLNGDEPVSTLTQDFHTRLDNLLRTLVHAKPHFVRCLRPNENYSSSEFDRNCIANQVRSLQILETVNLMHSGFPHRMRFKAFNQRYKSLAEPMKKLHKIESKAVEDCEFILDCYSKKAKKLSQNLTCNKDWAHGRKHIFLSEGARQNLERLREEKRQNSAKIIQQKWKSLKRRKNIQQKNYLNQNLNMIWRQRQRPKPISGTPPPLHENGDRCDFSTIQQTCSLFGLDLVSYKI